MAPVNGWTCATRAWRGSCVGAIVARRRRPDPAEAGEQAAAEAEELARRLSLLGRGASDRIPPHRASQIAPPQIHGRHYHYGGETGLVFWPGAMERNSYRSVGEAYDDYASLVPDGGWEIVEDVPLRVVTSKVRGAPARRRRKGWTKLSEGQRSRLVGAGRRRGMTRRQVYDMYRRGGSSLEELYGHRTRKVEREVRRTVELPPFFTVWTSHEDAQGRPIESGKPRRRGESVEDWIERTGADHPGEFRRGRLLWTD